MRYPNNPTKQK